MSLPRTGTGAPKHLPDRTGAGILAASASAIAAVTPPGD
jgi:hypothetical protein